MSLWREIEFRNILIDAAITLVALKYLDVSGFVELTLPYVIGFLLVVQSVIYFLAWGSETFEDLEEFRGSPLVRKIKAKAAVWLTAFVLFSWILSFIWVMVPIEFLQNKTGQYLYWTARISVVIGILTGLVMMIRHFATPVEKKQIEK
ncbi:MAG: hypothetical protein OEQ28_16655, partial [Acidobacteriota bacterium]|nr:hypothetical protein [Acidobacteriota bacterium]